MSNRKPVENPFLAIRSANRSDSVAAPQTISQSSANAKAQTLSRTPPRRTLHIDRALAEQFERVAGDLREHLPEELRGAFDDCTLNELGIAYLLSDHHARGNEESVIARLARGWAQAVDAEAVRSGKMNRQTNDEPSEREEHTSFADSASPVAESVEAHEIEILPAEELTEEIGKEMIERDYDFNRLLRLPSLWMTDIKPIFMLEIPLVGNESDAEAKMRRVEEIYRESPITELLVHLQLIEIKFTPIFDPRIGVGRSSTRFFLEDCAVTKRGAELGIEEDFDHMHLEVVIARRELLRITEIERQSDDLASLRFDWRWEPNEVWRALDSTSADHQALPARLRERLAKVGLTNMIPQGLEKTQRGVGDFVNTDEGWRLLDTTLDELPRADFNI